MSSYFFIFYLSYSIYFLICSLFSRRLPKTYSRIYWIVSTYFSDFYKSSYNANFNSYKKFSGFSCFDIRFIKSHKDRFRLNFLDFWISISLLLSFSCRYYLLTSLQKSSFKNRSPAELVMWSPRSVLQTVYEAHLLNLSGL